jgi:hypothetical protein
MNYLSYSLFILSITLSVLAQAPVPSIDLDQRCCFQFNDPQLPSFILPAPQLNSPGDIQLNVNNSITLYNGNAIRQGKIFSKLIRLFFESFPFLPSKIQYYDMINMMFVKLRLHVRFDTCFTEISFVLRRIRLNSPAPQSLRKLPS